MKKIAIQGGQASFHHMASAYFFRDQDFTILECATFREVCEAVNSGRAELAVMAIENSLAGGMLPNYALLEEYPLHIVDEIYLHIKQNLMALPGSKIEDIKTVMSHPMALLQCNEYLGQYSYIKGVEANDTADSARDIRKGNLIGTAAIASEMAAKTYDLEIIAEGIENDPHNYTRFLVLSSVVQVRSNANKASVNFMLHHHVGSLAAVLNLFERHQLNLTQIQSLPIPGCPSEYAFHVDLEWAQRIHFTAALNEMTEIARGIKLLGTYPKGEHPYDRPKSATA